MKERPILFNGEMVRAILAGRKTQTRRPIMPQPQIPAARFVSCNLAEGLWLPETNSGKSYLGPDWRPIRCPLGVVGDRLWVRETWGFSAKLPASTKSARDWLSYPDLRGYGADDPVGNWCWRASIHMPRWASRITLEITNVRVQRLQEITTSDIMAEATPVDSYRLGSANRYRSGFAGTWDAIYGKRGLGWDVNPWVWAIAFRRLEAAQ